MRKNVPKVNWRAFLTAEEDAFVRSAEVARDAVAKATRHFNKNFAERYVAIRNRAITRAATERGEK